MWRIYYECADGHRGVMHFPSMAFSKQQAIAEFEEAHPGAVIVGEVKIVKY